jgi:hypothetical protein
MCEQCDNKSVTEKYCQQEAHITRYTNTSQSSSHHR